MPSTAWKLAAAAARSHNHPPSRYHLNADPAARLPSSIPSEPNDEDAYLPRSEPRFLGGVISTHSFYGMRPGSSPSDQWGVSFFHGGCLFNKDMRSDKPGMPFEKKDLESEQALWALYNRWCSYFNVLRSSVEKDYRFNIFKEKARMVYDLRSADPKNLELNHLCDVSIDELCPPKSSCRRYK
ncbi:hypothetical protein BS78_10G270400 [Paspalum vaginatum]|nr:hypothetical protein BS78_10G270400 [Paspalum vaginatum]